MRILTVMTFVTKESGLVLDVTTAKYLLATSALVCTGYLGKMNCGVKSLTSITLM
jgi:hypothetical protein